MNHNPYAAPSADLTKDVTGAEWADVALRQAHLQHEVQLTSVGSLYLLAGLVWGVASAIGTPAYFDLHPFEPAWLKVITVALLLLTVLVLVVVGIGFRGLQSWVRIPGAALSIGGLLLFPLGTLINAYVLYLMYCPKGRTVLAPDYARVRAATPHLRPSRGLLGTLIPMVLIGLITFVLLQAYFGAR